MHPTFVLGPQIVPKPANGLFSAVGNNGTAVTWANVEMRAQLAVWAKESPQHASYVNYFLNSDSDHYGMAIQDQVDGLPVIAGTDAAKALAAGTTNTRFINVAPNPMLALNAAGRPLDGNPSPDLVTQAWAWQGPNAQGVPNINLDNLLSKGYVKAFNFNLGHGAGGS